MKAVTSVCATGGVSGGRIKRRDVENEEIQMYLSKLKELVPFMPKNRKLSKLEVIQYVIDYICDLQEALETQPGVLQSAAAAVLPTVRTTPPTVAPRQPLGVLAPNTLVPTSCSTQEASTAPVHLLEKVTSPTDAKPVSC